MTDEYAPTPAGTLDNAGTPFDPSKHAKFRTGRAMKDRAGNWFVNKGRPPKGGTPVSTPSEPLKNRVSEVEPPVPSKVEKGGVPGAFEEWKQPVATPVPGDKTPVTEAPKSTLGKVAGDPVDENGIPTPQAPTSGRPALDELEMKARESVAELEAAGLMFSPDLKHSQEERDALAARWKRHLEAGGKGVDLPPSVSLALGYLGLIVDRLQRPTFRDRCMTVWKKLTGK